MPTGGTEAAALLENEADWNGTKIKRMIGNGGERHVILKAHVPVHLTYFTAAVDENGKILLREDIYGHDRRIAAALGW